jgi:Xaa-Pro aminopeptidase
MKRVAAITILVWASSVLAQPAKKQPKAPVDPYADTPPVVGPAPPPGGVKQPDPPVGPKAPKTDPKPPVGPAAPKGDPKAPGPTVGPRPDPKAPPVGPGAPKTDPKAPLGPAAPKDPKGPADPYTAPAFPSRVGLSDVPAVQGLLAVQRLDGWLLFDRDGANPIARRLVAPDGTPTRPWFYMIPQKGQPVALVHDSEKRNFEHLVGTKLTYTGYRDLDKQLRTVLKGLRTIAVEYSPKAAVPAVSRVDAGTMEVIKGAGVQVRSSDTLVQYTKAIWGDAGRTAHYIAVHHLVEMRKEAFAFVTKQISQNKPVTEYEVQQQLTRAMKIRGLVGSAPVVAAGINTADPYYVPTAAKTATIRRGDLIVVSLAARADKNEGVYAAQTWVAVADTFVRDDYKKAFETATLARDHALALITDRARKNRPVTGAEVDQSTRAFIKKAGFGDRIMHRTGHSIDNDLQGGGADLDDFEVRDTRILTTGTGFTVGPGLYVVGNFGVRTEVSVYLSPSGPEVTTPAQDYVETLLTR